MRLNKLKLHNFKGLKDFELDLGGDDARVLGTNGTGKTTLMDGLLWLVTGKDSLGQTEQTFDIKPKDESGEVQHGLDQGVEAELETDDGHTITLEKIYAEKWAKKKGTNNERLTGHETTCKVDGVPVNKGEFEDKVEELFPDDTFRILSDPMYFGRDMHWSDRRDILLDMGGDISMEKVIEDAPELSRLPDVLEGRTIEEHRKVVRSRKKKINDELEGLGHRIDERNDDIPDEVPDNPEELEAQKEELTQKIQQAREELSELDADEAQKELKSEVRSARRAVRQARERVEEAEEEAEREARQKRREIQDMIDDTDTDIGKIAREMDKVEYEIEEAEESIHQSKQRVEKLRDRYAELHDELAEVDARTFEDTATGGPCATCGQDRPDHPCPDCGLALPEEELEEAREKFRQNQSDRLDDLEGQMKEVTQKASGHKESIQEMEDKRSHLQERRGELQAKLDDLEEEKNNHLAEKEEIEVDTSGVEELQAELDEAKEALQERRQELESAESGDTSDQEDRLEEKIEQLEEERQDVIDQLDVVETARNARQRIEELKEKETELSQEYEKLDGQDDLMDQYVLARVDMLEKQVNSLFDKAEFKLFNRQLNGGIDSTCEVTYDGVPFSTSLNHGAQVAVGLDIIDTLSDHFGIEAPVMVDNAEAVVDMPDVGFQLIQLIVSEDHKQLTIQNKEKIT